MVSTRVSLILLYSVLVVIVHVFQAHTSHHVRQRPPDGDGSFLNAHRPPPGGFGSLYSILETKAQFRGDQFPDDGIAKKARIRYYMSYGRLLLFTLQGTRADACLMYQRFALQSSPGWSPWNVDFMEDCNVIVMNLGLHYKPHGNHTGKISRHNLMDDMKAAITYMANFTASKTNRIAVW